MEGEINVGDPVRVLGSDAVGTVSRILKDHNKLVVSLSRFEFTISSSQVSVIPPADAKKLRLRRQQDSSKISTEVERPNSENFPTEIDFHGFLVHEALAWLEVWIDRALLTSHQSLKIIHGKGTGALRTAVRQYLKNHKHVKISKSRSVPQDDGVTCIEL